MPHAPECQFGITCCTCGNTEKILETERLGPKDVEIERLRKVLGNVLWMLQGDRTGVMLDRMTTYVEFSLGVGVEAKPEQPQELGEHPIG